MANVTSDSAYHTSVFCVFQGILVDLVFSANPHDQCINCISRYFSPTYPQQKSQNHLFLHFE